ncbi:hypothetical protein B5X24_HaOG209709 [Helicoverpa armigera]|uniref:Uncharacterized protein n=1 Tax=Helicoverpa armigera TaxID=29058 RepID=A0A2W1BDM4_HELAM|nr:hypothetical protein B5X24_HaOG209709 [Helicoverpa armigera]
MAPVTKGLILAACIVLCTAQPLEKREAPQLPVLKDQPAEVLFRADNYSTVLLECATEGREKDVKAAVARVNYQMFYEIYYHHVD